MRGRNEESSVWERWGRGEKERLASAISFEQFFGVRGGIAVVGCVWESHFF